MPSGVGVLEYNIRFSLRDQWARLAYQTNVEVLVKYLSWKYLTTYNCKSKTSVLLKMHIQLWRILFTLKQEMFKTTGLLCWNLIWKQNLCLELFTLLQRQPQSYLLPMLSQSRNKFPYCWYRIIVSSVATLAQVAFSTVLSCMLKLLSVAYFGEPHSSVCRFL